MLVLLLLVFIAAPLVLGPLLVFQHYRCVLPRVTPMDEDAAYAPELFRHYVWNQERELSPLGFSLLGCTAETTGTGRLRYTAVFERFDHTDFVLASAAFEQDSYRSPRKLVYTEVGIVSRIQNGTWVITNDAHLVRPGSYRVQRISAGRLPPEQLLRMHEIQLGDRTKRPNAGMAHDDNYAALLQESLETQEIYDALARRDLMQDEETGEIRPTWIGAILLGWRHFGITAWVCNLAERLNLHRPQAELMLPETPALAHGEE